MSWRDRSVFTALLAAMSAILAALIGPADGGLTMSFGPDKVLGTLAQMSGDTYAWAWPGWPGNTATVTFKADAAGVVHKLTILECADVNGGDFKTTAP